MDLLSNELRYLIQLADVEWHTTGLVLAVGFHEVVYPILSSANDRYLCSGLDQAISHRLPNAGSTSNH